MKHFLNFILLFLFFLFLSLSFYYIRLQTGEKLADYTECIKHITDISDMNDINLSLYSNPLIYFHSKNSIELLNDDSLNDNDFHIRFHRNVLRYKRKVEYCQWIEYVHVYTEENKTYSYVQKWCSAPILSLYYGEALSHVNPQRYPYSSKTVTLSQAKIGKLIFKENLIEQLNSFKYINDDNDMFIESAGKYASAYNEHQFEYIGNGYFYSQYEKVILNSRSTMNELPTKTKITEYLQQRHLIGLSKSDECVAGDILIEFSIIKPESISIIAKAIPYTNGVILLDSYKTKHNFDIYSIYDGKVSVDDILNSVSFLYTLYNCLFYLSSILCFIILIVAPRFLFTRNVL